MAENEDSRFEKSSRLPNWVSQIHLSLSQVIKSLVGVSVPYSDSRLWPLYAILIGTLPLLLSFLFRVPGHPLVSAVLLSLMCLGLVSKDRWMQCITAISLAFVFHSVMAVGLSRQYPEVCAEILPKAASYWDRQERWIKTGINEEYEVSSWLPGHIQMFFGTAFFSFTSFGAVVFHEGFVQVDMMNYYNAQLAKESQSEIRAIGFGWHLWSLMRGLGYLFVTYEMISLSVEFLLRQSISTWKKRTFRWTCGLGFLIADCVIKFYAVEAVREKLFENLV